MISPIENDLISQIVESEVTENGIEAINHTTNSFFLVVLAERYNWDDGLEIPNAIADSKYCDLGVALTLFWLAEALYYVTDEIEKSEYNIEWLDFCQKLSTRITDGYYQLGAVSFEPPVSKVQCYKLSKQGIPEVFYSKITADS